MTGWLEPITKPLSAAGKTIQKLIETRDLLKFGDTFRELYAEILSATQGALDAQARESAMLDEISGLKTRVTELETWGADKERYALKELPPGVFVYALRQDQAKPGEPLHQICQRCYQEREKSILDRDAQRNGIYHLKCNRCGTVQEVGHYIPQRATIAHGRDYDPFGP